MVLRPLLRAISMRAPSKRSSKGSSCAGTLSACAVRSEALRAGSARSARGSRPRRRLATSFAATAAPVALLMKPNRLSGTNRKAIGVSGQRQRGDWLLGSASVIATGIGRCSHRNGREAIGRGRTRVESPKQPGCTEKPTHERPPPAHRRWYNGARGRKAEPPTASHENPRWRRQSTARTRSTP